LAPSVVRIAPAGAQPAQPIRDPFTLGVASGDPLPDAVVIWTRLAPDPLARRGGMPDRAVPVRWEVAADEGFARIVRRGTVQAQPSKAHSVHIDVQGLQPGSWYWYRFRVDNTISPVGRTRTAPARGSAAPVAFAFASCSQYEHGYFTAYRHLADEDVDVVFHLGDYIYEYEANVSVAASGNVRDHVGREIRSLLDYRRRYAQYKLDGDLQAAHASAPWIVIWDDHETDNNYADLIPENRNADEGNATTATFRRRRANAYRAYWEHMPLRMSRQPDGADMQLYRRFTFGSTARFSMLDTRQYRDDQACGDVAGALCDEAFDPARTILGDPQQAWLQGNLTTSPATWNVVPQQIFFANRDQDPTPATDESPNNGGYNDGWDGYRADRDEILRFVADQSIDNFVVLTGDVHTHWLNDLRVDFEDEDSPVVGTELVSTSITSRGDGTDQNARFVEWAPENPHMRYSSNRRGYVRCAVDPQQFRADFRVVPYVSRRAAPIRTDASFVIESGNPRAEPA
jgi:alkaline phosphatase D